MGIMSLGTFVFSVPTLLFEQMTRRREWHFAENARIGARDATQFLGAGDERISLEGVAVIELQDPRASLDQLGAMADQGGRWPLIDGAGYIYGYYEIRGIDERTKAFLPDGRGIAIEFTIDLKRVDDPSVTATVKGAA